MANDDINKFKKLIRPLKELIEVVNHKVDKINTSQVLSSAQIKAIKDQQSVMNEKLDTHSASLVNIEQTLEGYGDMYEVNKEKTKDLDKRVGAIEDHLGLKN